MISIYDELKAAGNIRNFFDITDSLDSIDQISHKTFLNNRPFHYLGDPTRFYTELPSLLLSILPAEKGRHIAILRQAGIIPNISMSGLGCIIYIDDEGNLAGFNENFIDLLKLDRGNALKIVGLQANQFFHPLPSQIIKERLLSSKPRHHKEFKLLADYDFLGAVPHGISFTHNKTFILSPVGLRIANHTDDITYLMNSSPLTTTEDFTISVDMTIMSGLPPAMFISGESDPSKYMNESPDSNGYQIGVMSRIGRYGVKRQAVLQDSFEKESGLADRKWTILKTGNTIRLIENDNTVIEYCDFEFLHSSRANFVIGIRPGSQAIIRNVKILTAPAPHMTKRELPPMVTLNTDPKRTALLTRINNTHLAANHRGVTAWSLEDISELQSRLSNLTQENIRLRKAIETGSVDFIGESPAITKLKEQVVLIAKSTTTVLIQGATGSGKEMVAKEIHRQGSRSKMPFIKVDCSLIPSSLIESELFGHEKGAFTGATEQKKGRFEEADGGTLFLDEISNIPFDIQAKLLQFFQEKTIHRLAGTKPISLNVRIITAANISLSELVSAGKFREDLYYRINVVTLNIPPLRERKEDISLLSIHFLNEFSTLHGKAILGFSHNAIKKLLSYNWPGNVRELRNTIERSVIFSHSTTIEADDLIFADDTKIKSASKRGSYKKSNLIDLNEVIRLSKVEGLSMKEISQRIHSPVRTIYNALKKMQHGY